MEIVVLICLVVALDKAIEYGGKRAYRSARSAASTRWQASTATRPATRTGNVGAAVGRGLGAGTAAAFHGGRGFVSGAREGWPTGWQQGRDWHERRQPPTPLQEALSTEAPPAPAGRPDDAVPQVRPRQRIRHAPKGYAAAAAVLQSRSWGEVPDQAWRAMEPDSDPGYTLQIRRTPGGPVESFTTADRDEFEEWRTRAANDPDIAEYGGTYMRMLDDPPSPNDDPGGSGPASPTESPDDPQEPTEGEPDMSTIDTIAGGEVYTMDQLIAELGTIQNEAVSELEDATGDAQRAKEDAGRVELMVASLTTLRLDSQSLGEIGALAEDAQSRLTTAEQRQAAAEARAAHAQAAADGVQQRHGAIREHADTMAERAFYQG